MKVDENEKSVDASRRAPTRSLKQPWLLASALGLFAAAFFWFAGWAEAAFVAAALGVVAWFLNVRATLPRSNARATRDDEDEFESDASRNEYATDLNEEDEEGVEDGERRFDGSPRARR